MHTDRKERDIKSAIITGPTGAIGVALCELLLSEEEMRENMWIELFEER